jgi:hypothetical protein
MKTYKIISNTFPFSLEENGNVVEYEIRELKQGPRERYMDSVRERGDVSPEGNITIKKFSGMHADLLGVCVFKKGSSVSVGAEFAANLPPEISSELFHEAQRLNKLTAPAPEEKAAEESPGK